MFSEKLELVWWFPDCIGRNKVQSLKRLLNFDCDWLWWSSIVNQEYNCRQTSANSGSLENIINKLFMCPNHIEKKVRTSFYQIRDLFHSAIFRQNMAVLHHANASLVECDILQNWSRLGAGNVLYSLKFGIELYLMPMSYPLQSQNFQPIDKQTYWTTVYTYVKVFRVLFRSA